jgi:hypothetical protein
MNEPTQNQIDAAERLGVSLYFTEAPITIARLVEIVERLQRRVVELEGQKASWRKS